MAAPNIKTATTFYGKTAVLAVTTVAADIVANAAASGKVLKVNVLNIANVDGAASASITASIYRSSTEYKIAHTVVVPADNVVSILERPIYLEEGDSLRLTASANGDLTAVASYEEIG